MKLGPAIEPYKRNTTKSKQVTMTSSRPIISLSIFLLFMANSEESRSRIPSAWSVVLAFSLQAIFFADNSKIKVLLVLQGIFS